MRFSAPVVAAAVVLSLNGAPATGVQSQQGVSGVAVAAPVAGAPLAVGEAVSQPGLAGAGANEVFDPALFKDLEYRSIGPTQGGRVTAVAGVPDQTSTFYMGATGGGVWKTTDSGDNWSNISDGYFTTPSIGVIRVAPSNHDVVYVGTGSDGLRSNVITGDGVYRSNDAGKTWKHIGLENVGQIGRMEIDPTNPDVAYVGAIGNPFKSTPDRGVYKTTDGGQSWSKVLFLSNEIGVYGLVMEPGNANVLYAAAWRAQRKPWTIISGTDSDQAGIYKSTDAGKTWTHLSKGLPSDLVGKIDLSISPAKPDRVYALIEAPTAEEGMYRTDDAGASWERVSGLGDLMRRPFYYTNVDADPSDPDTVYVMNEGFFRSKDGGKTWERRGTPHGDNHDMWINPKNPAIYIEGNDGGANVTINDGATWSAQDNQPTAELYEVDVTDEYPFWACAGQQDDGTICVPNVPPGKHAPNDPTGWWRAVAGCETGPAVPKPGKPSTVYGNCKGEFSSYDFTTGQESNYWVGAYYMYGAEPKDLPDRFQRVSPIEVSPHNPDVIYHGSQYLYRSTNEGKNWKRISPDLTATPPGTQGVSGEPITRDITGEEFYSTLYAVEESPVKKGVIWTGSNDGPFNVTRNGGKSWTDVTPKGMPSGGRVKAIEPSPYDAGTAYYAAYRFLLGDYRPYIYRTENYGKSWELLTDGKNGIPANVPTRTIREDPVREGLLYAGTDSGMFVSFDDGSHWQPMQQNLPVTPVTDIEIVGNDMVLSTMGRGFWVMDDIDVLRQLTKKVASSKVTLFDPGPVYRTHYPTYDLNEENSEEEEEEGGEEESSTLESSSTQQSTNTEQSSSEQSSSGQATAVNASTSNAEGAAASAAAPAAAVPAAADAEDGATVNPTFPEYPRAGANIDYYLADGARKVEMKIYDGRKLVRSFTSRPLTEYTPLQTAGTAPLPTDTGMHRVQWDLRTYGAWSTNLSSRGTGGPLVTPGKYRVQLIVDGKTQATNLVVRIDPRVKAAGTTQKDLEKQYALNVKIRDALSQARQAADRIDTALANLEGQSGEPADTIRAQLLALREQLVTDQSISYPERKLIDQISYLYNMTNAADQALGQDAFVRYGQVRKQLDKAQAQLNQILKRCGNSCK